MKKRINTIANMGDSLNNAIIINKAKIKIAIGGAAKKSKMIAPIINKTLSIF